MEGKPPFDLGELRKRYLTERDQISVSGQIEGEIAFRCTDVFPPVGMITRSRGTSTISMGSHRMQLTAEGTDALSRNEVGNLLGQSPEPRDSSFLPFEAHVIFHGPELYIRESGTNGSEKNDFLGERTSTIADSHLFTGEGYQGALIQQKEELHLHIRSKNNTSIAPEAVGDLVTRISRSVGFSFGFHPWPAYREIRIDHAVKERWISPRLNLTQSFLAPISKALWHTYFSERSNLLYSVVPTIAHGLGKLSGTERERIETLLWHVQSSDLNSLPHSTKVLILCAALDGLMQVICGMGNEERMPTNQFWRKASDTVGLAWDSWTSKIFELRKKHRDDLSHGRLWIAEENDFYENHRDYALLGCAFMTIIAARCGYDGPVIADPYEPRKVVISSIKSN